jgi:uncharacterized repeat protein (TIGR03803 family)
LTPDGVVSTFYAFKDDGTEGLTVYAPLIQGVAPDDSLYGTTYIGGGQGLGTLFRLTLDGTYTVLHQFGGGRPNPDRPYAGVTVGPDGFLYGTTLWGGSRNAGTVWRIATDGTDFSVLHHFNGDNGAHPEGTLVVGADGMLYGTTMTGGSRDSGTIYRISTSGNHELLYSFPRLGGFSEDGMPVNATGAHPRAGLMLSTDGDFYGTAAKGGEHGYGTLIRVTPAGSVSVVHAFEGPYHGGGEPATAVVQDALGNFYGTTLGGGAFHAGSAWRISPEGEFTLLHGFTGGAADGHSPYMSLLLANGSIYATSSSEGSGPNGYGAIFRLDESTGGPLPVELTVSAREVTAGTAVTLTWVAPAGSTCTKTGGNGDWKNDPGVAGSQSFAPIPGAYVFGLSCVDADDGNEATPRITRNAYAAVVVNAPLLSPVDGGGGAGSLSLWWLLLAAALLYFKASKEIRPSCP